MSLQFEDFNIELLRDIFRTHPMWNYNFYMIIESNDEGIEPVGIGFKKIEILDKHTNMMVSIDSESIQNLFSNEQYKSQIICESGMTHDGAMHKFIDEVNSGSAGKRNVLIMEIEKCCGEYKDRVEKASTTVTSVKRAWLLENAYPLTWITSGFDAMSNEIFIQNVKLTADNIDLIEMSEEIAREKAKIAVSKLF